MTKRSPVRPEPSEALIEAAFSVLNADPSASLTDIVDAAGVSRATFHRHFAGREALLETLALRALQETEQAADSAGVGAASYIEALERIFYAMVPLGDKHRFLTQKSVVAMPKVIDAIERQRQDMRKVMLTAKEEGLTGATCPVEWMELCYDYLIAAAWELVSAQKATPEQAGRLAWGTFMRGLQGASL